MQVRSWVAIGIFGLGLAAGACSGDDEVDDGVGDGAGDTQLSPAARHGHGARATRFAELADLTFGVAGDADVVFVTHPLARRISMFDRDSGAALGDLPAPPGGFLLPFTVRVPRAGHLVVLDPGGFPSPTVPSIARVYDYRYRVRHHRVEAELTRTVSFEGLPVVFAEDVEVTDGGDYVMSESIIGALWVIHPDGSIVPGVFPASPDPADAIAALGPCIIPTATIAGIPFHAPGNFGPGVLSLASHRGWLYFSSTCRGGIQRIPVASLTDGRAPFQRAADIEVVSPRPAGEVETFEGLAFDRFDPKDHHLYASDSFRLQIVRIDVDSGEREVVAADPILFNFPVEMQFLPKHHGRHALVVASDQEYRLAAINAGITTDMLQPPFVVTEVVLPKRH